MNEILRSANLSEIRRVIEDNLYSFWRTCTRVDLKNVKYTENENFYRFSTGIPFFLVNGILDAKIPPEIAEETIKELLQSYQKDKLPFYWFVGPLSKPNYLSELLRKENPSFVELTPGLAISLKELSIERGNLPNVTIKKVKDHETFAHFVEVFVKGFEVPKDLLFDFLLDSLSLTFLGENSPVSAFLAYYNGLPVASSIGFYGSGVIGLYGIATLKEARGNRIGSAITLAPLHEAKDRGYEIGILHSTEMGLNMYKRIGFKEYIQIERFVWNL